MLKKVVVVFILILIVVAMFYYKDKVREQKINHIMDQVSIVLKSKLKSDKMDDLKMALFLSKNKALVDALENDDEDLGYKLLSEITSTIKKETDILVRAQIITKELNIFARSWDDMYAGMPLGEYRKDFKYFETNKVPRTSIEIGRRLGIKATVPIYKGSEFLGFVEVISFFKSITEFFNSMGVDIYVLLDVKYIDTAVLMMQNLMVDDYIVSNRNYNYDHIQTLKKIDFQKLKLDRLAYKDNKYIFYETMYDGDYKAIGGFVFVLDEKYLDYFRNPEDDISFLINVTRGGLYDVVKREKYNNNVYDKYSANSMVYLQDVIDKQDRQIFLDEAYEKFDEYSKDELIQMMLERNIVKKIDGKIK
ncbi:hypothetical protein M947_02065 [Sulfurimonas hongkongensis]|uniref:Double Cache domain-containing protein n=1 Tax=Sulfurimonas hongkongensis TaxID=1172190 RepID=T0KUF4_9BACT|nr:cache domain-containing protein [Sulfurimonas hongkongensis]EQB40614.1 hypothetical protein M947_02065 [Sulfurimonas hongkongensis]